MSPEAPFGILFVEEWLGGGGSDKNTQEIDGTSKVCNVNIEFNALCCPQSDKNTSKNVKSTKRTTPQWPLI